MIHAALRLMEVLPAEVTEQSLQALSGDSAAQAAASVAPAQPDFLMAALQMVVALTAVLALILGLAWAAKRWLPASVVKAAGTDRIDILASRSLGPRRSLTLVRARGRVILLGTTPQQITPLTEWEEMWNPAAEEDEAARDAAITEFEQLLALRQQQEREAQK